MRSRYSARSAASQSAAPHAALAELQFQRRVERLHRLGPRVLCELLAEIGAETPRRQTIENKIDRYLARLSPELLAATGGDSFAAPPIHLVRRTDQGGS